MATMAERIKARALGQQDLTTKPIAPPQPTALAPAPQVNNIANPNANPDRFKQFGVMRMRAQQQGNQAKTEQGEALKRRFAALGNINSGAYVKAAGLQDAEADRATREAVENVDMAEQQEKSRLQDVQEERQYQAGEAEKLRIFNRELFDKDQDFKKTVFADESKFRNLNYQLAQADLEESKKANKLNALQAISNLDDDQLSAASGLEYSGGFLGIGGTGDRQASIKALLRKYGY